MSWKVIPIEGPERTINTRATIRDIEKEIGAEYLDSVNLRDGNVMMVDDTGYVDGKPVNQRATQLYHSICRPGTLHRIYGVVAIVRDSDFA